MSQVSFWTAVSYGSHSQSVGQTLLGKVDGYFYIGKKVEVIPNSCKGKTEEVKSVNASFSRLETTAKVISYFTIIFPLILFCAKIILRSKHRFCYVQQGNVPTNNGNIPSPSTRNTPSPTGPQPPRLDDTNPTNNTEREYTEQDTAAARTIQRVFRGCQSRKKCEELKTQYLTNYDLELDLFFPEGMKTETIRINDENSAKNVVEKIDKYVNQEFLAICINFNPSYQSSPYESLVRAAHFQKLAIHTLHFEGHKIQTKTIKTKELSDGKTRYTYANGIQEIISKRSTSDRLFDGTRTFPDGRKEHGKFFASSKELLSGYQIGSDGNITFVCPHFLASYGDEHTRELFGILLVEEKLVVVNSSKDKIIEASVEEVLLEISHRKESIKAVLAHPAFADRRSAFIQHTLEPNKEGSPLLFGFGEKAAADVVENACANGDIKDPLAIVDTKTGINLFSHAAHQENEKLLEMLITHFPDAFISVGREILFMLIHQQVRSYFLERIYSNFSQLEGRLIAGGLSPYETLQVMVSAGLPLPKTIDEEKVEETEKKKLEKIFLDITLLEKTFNELTDEEKQKLYDLAFTHNNPFVHEPSDPPVEANQYSINLLWINEDKMSDDQEFLLGKGDTAEEQKKDFYKRFVKPVSAWAKANPGTSINIWIDREMANSKSIEYATKALDDELKETSHGTFQFRDVREIDVVQTNRNVFSPDIDLDLRIDLLRAIVANHILAKKETEFFVSGDIDMIPLSRQELFDKKTVDFLNEYGFVMAKKNSKIVCFDSAFQILSGNHLQFMKSHRIVMIDLNLEMASQTDNLSIGNKPYSAMLTHLLEKMDDQPDLQQFKDKFFWHFTENTLTINGSEYNLKDIMPTKPVQI